MPVDVEFQQQIRDYEREQIMALMRQGSTVLEVGAGAGWQAKRLAERGFDVEAIDVAGSRYEGCRAWDVVLYDGKTIPFPDGSMDVVFTSHVLDQVPDCAALLVEIKRVLRPGGFAVHFLPTVTWRLWTTATPLPAALEAIDGYARKDALPA